MLTNRVFRFAKRSNLKIAVMKGIQFADTQESCFETWKRSHMVCAALLCGRFDDAQKSLIQVWKRLNVGTAVKKILQFADSH